MAAPPNKPLLQPSKRPPIPNQPPPRIITETRPATIKAK